MDERRQKKKINKSLSRETLIKNRFLKNKGVPGQQPQQPQFVQPFPGQPIHSDLSIPPAHLPPPPSSPSTTFTPSQPFNPQPTSFLNNNVQQPQQQVPALVPIGNIPLQGQTQPAIVPNQPAPLVQSTAIQPTAATAAAAASPPAVLLPAQFALSGNSLLQQTRKGKSISSASSAVTSNAIGAGNGKSHDLIDCGAGNDLGFCAVSDKYPRYTKIVSTSSSILRDQHLVYTSGMADQTTSKCKQSSNVNTYRVYDNKLDHLLYVIIKPEW